MMGAYLPSLLIQLLSLAKGHWSWRERFIAALLFLMSTYPIENLTRSLSHEFGEAIILLIRDYTQNICKG